MKEENLHESSMMPISAKSVTAIRFYHTTEAAGTKYNKFNNETLTNVVM